MILNIDYQLVIYIQTILIFIGILLIIFLFYRLNQKKRELEKIHIEIDEKISDSIKLYVQKSEQDIQLFFDFEDVLTEIYKLIKKMINENIPMKKTLENIEQLMTEILNKKY